MSDTTRKQHWEQVYSARSPLEVSWYQREPSLSLQLIEEIGLGPEAPLIDVGGGASLLVDYLLQRGYRRLAVLDISAQALQHVRQRLGAEAESVEWFASDITEFSPPHRFGIWHDRAVFHFLTAAEDRRRYVQALQEALLPDGQVIIAAFGPEGPTQCSNLDIVQYDAAKIGAELGAGFKLLEQQAEQHHTPAGKVQAFNYFRFARA